MIVDKISSTLKLKKSNPSIVIKSIIKLNRNTSFNVSNQCSRVQFCGRSHDKKQERKKRKEGEVAAPPRVVVGGKKRGKGERSDQNLGNDTILEMIFLAFINEFGRINTR